MKNKNTKNWNSTKQNKRRLPLLLLWRYEPHNDWLPQISNNPVLEEHPKAPKCPTCNSQGHDEENCYFAANMENRPLK